MEKEIIKAKMIDTGNGCFIFAKERYGYDSPCPHCKGLGIIEPNTDKIVFDFEGEQKNEN